MDPVTMNIEGAVWSALRDTHRTALEGLHLLQQYTWQDAKDAYVYLVTEIVPGPMSLSYFVPFILLPLALMIPPQTLSHKQLCCYFLPPIYAGVIHAWSVMGGVDVISVDGLLWSTLLIGFRDVRKDFRRLLIVPERAEPTRKNISNAPNGANAERSNEKSGEKTVGSLQPDASTAHETAETDGLQPTGENGIFEQSYPTELLPRLKWVLTLLGSTRFCAWLIGSPTRDQWQLRNVRSHPSRKRFVAALIGPTIFIQALVLPLVLQLSMYDPSIISTSPPKQAKASVPLLGSSAKAPPQTVVFLQQHVPASILSAFTTGLYVACVLSGGYYQRTGLVVLSNYLFGLPSDSWSPHTLPNNFGSMSSVFDHGVSGLWGKWWHQIMRQMVSGPGLALADYIGLTEERLTREKDHRRKEMLWNCRYTLQVISGFFFSGISHMGLIPPLILGGMGLRLRIASFFTVQAVAVIFERLVASMFATETSEQKFRPQSVLKTTSLRALRLAWVIAWLSLTLPLLHLPADRLGWWKLYPPPGYPPRFRYYMRGDWIP